MNIGVARAKKVGKYTTSFYFMCLLPNKGSYQRGFVFCVNAIKQLRDLMLSLNYSFSYSS